jgi:hypothetical protein
MQQEIVSVVHTYWPKINAHDCTVARLLRSDMINTQCAVKHCSVNAQNVRSLFLHAYGHCLVWPKYMNSTETGNK